MQDVQIQLAGLWAATMLVYLLGDVFRMMSGDVTPGNMNGIKFTQRMWLGVAALMVIPIVMLVLTLMLPQPINRWANIIAAGFFLLFNLVGLPSYPSAYDKFLLAVSLVFNLAVIWLAWGWA
jgi:hypothetical protein